MNYCAQQKYCKFVAVHAKYWECNFKEIHMMGFISNEEQESLVSGHLLLHLNFTRERVSDR